MLDLRSTRVRDHILGTLLAVCAVAPPVWWALYGWHMPGWSPVDAINSREPRQFEALVEVRSDAPSVGAPDADIAIVEFSDFECEFCRLHDQVTLKEIQRRYVDTGQVRYIALNYPLRGWIDQAPGKAAEAAECSLKLGRYWEMRERLYQASLPLSPHDLLAHGTELQLSSPDYEQCLETGMTAEKVLKDVSEGQRLGIRATPTFVIGRVRRDGNVDASFRIDGAQSFSAFEAAVEEVLALDGSQ